MYIEVKDLTQIYMPKTPFEKTALDRVSFSIQQGEFIGLIGHTGSGKSTLIQHLNGLLRPYDGTVSIEGVDFFNTKDKNILKGIRQKVGLVFQYPEHQLFEMTIFKEISFGPRNLGLTEEEIYQRVRRAMQRVGLDESFDHKSPFELSGGQKRRVAIAGVLAMEPKILVLDEPTAGLDPRGKEAILSQIKDLHKEYGLTTILVSHSMEDIAKVADRILVMHGGRLVMDGTPKDIFVRQEELISIGLGVPQITTLARKLKEQGFDIPENIITIEEAKKYLLPLLQKGGTARAE